MFPGWLHSGSALQLIFAAFSWYITLPPTIVSTDTVFGNSGVAPRICFATVPRYLQAYPARSSGGPSLQVVMGIVDTRNGRAAMQVNHARLRTSHRLNGLRIAGCHYAVAANSQRFDVRVCSNACKYLAIEEEKSGSPCGCANAEIDRQRSSRERNIFLMIRSK